MKHLKEVTIGGKLTMALLFAAAVGGSTFWFYGGAKPTASKSIGEKVIVRISGSNTIGESLVPALVKNYVESIGYKNIVLKDSAKEEKIISCVDTGGKELEIHISAHGTKTGFESLTTGKSEICMASFPTKSEFLEEHVIGLDGIAIIINNKSNISELTTEDLKSIFSGNTTDWSQIQKSDMTGKINVFRMDDNSGTFKTFKEMLGNTEFEESATKISAASEMVKSISTTKNSIGFVSFAFLNSTVKTVPIKVGDYSIEPNALSIQSEKYPFCRRLYMYKSSSIDNKLASDILAYAESPEGQKIVENNGFIDLSMNYDKPIVFPNDPKEYVELINNSKKLTSELRFNSGSKELDTRAVADIDRLISFLSRGENRKKTITLVGFSDNVGDPKRNVVLSKQRAESVQTILEQKGATVKVVYGLGQLRPVRSNDSEEGKSSNRRVEIWVM